ncbi:MAG TPA: hypothetical protein VF756_19145 [Thermoanaerobaculia bacterium]
MPPPSPPTRRWRAALILVFLASVALAVGTRQLSVLLARVAAPTDGAQWIWMERDRKDVSPAAFYAARDFEVESPPARARLMAIADPEYILYLNGRRVGSGTYGEGGRLDTWEVGPLLQPGTNRLLAELRSDRGAGGFLAALEDAEGEVLVRTDESWRVFPRHELGLLRGWMLLQGPGSPESQPAFCWGYPPTGRWGMPAAGDPKPLFPDVVRGRPVPAASTVRPGRPPGFPADLPSPPQILFDWGREVTGYLTLALPPSTERTAALLFTGDVPPRPLADPPAAVAILPGRGSWTDALPRRFRYALVVGLKEPVTAQVQRVDETAAASLLAGVHRPARGVFGIAPPSLRTPVEHEIWGDLESVPGVAGREKL